MTNNDGHRWVYKTARWARLRLARLAAEPLCRYCGQIGRITMATTVDHVRPHKGDRSLAFDFDNTQSLCKPCHDKFAQMKDRGDPLPGCDDEGYPLDPSHPWHKDNDDQ